MALFPDSAPVVIAHRGSRWLWPENTMVAFEGAVALGVRHIETDLRLSGDGVLMCCHDARLERTTDARGPVRALTASQLAEVDAGFRFGTGQGHPHRGKGLGIPRFEEVADRFSDAVLFLDMKEEGLEEPLAEFLEQHGLRQRVVVGSFSDERLQRFRRLTGNQVATSASPKEAQALFKQAWLRRASQSESPAVALQVPQFWRGVPVVTPRLISQAHSEGMQVHVWTINHPARMRLLLKMGVDGIITDRPDLMQKVICKADTR